MLRSIKITNFKGIGQQVTIPLKPVTLLFGHNSAGKSSILQAIHYTRMLLERGVPNIGHSRIGGPTMDLGGFQSFAHNHKADQVVALSFAFDLLPGYYEEHIEPTLTQELELELEQTENIRTMEVGLSIKWSDHKNDAIVDSCTITVDDCFLASLRTTDELKPNPILEELSQRPPPKGRGLKESLC